LTVCLVILGKYVPALKFFDIILGDAPALTPETKFYQRLLVRDQDEAAEVVREQWKEHNAEQVIDRLFIPALIGARLDVEAMRLNEVELQFMMQAIQDIAEEQDFGRSEQSADVTGAEPENDESRSTGKVNVLACPAREGIDETALALFCRLVDPKVCCIETVSSQQLVSEIIARVADKRPSIVCIVALPSGGLAQTRLLCKRLRSRFNRLKIVIGRWGMTDVENERAQLRLAGTEYFATTIHDTMAQLVQLGQLTQITAESDELSEAVKPQELVAEAHLML
jgi:hypothetical protein